MAPLRLKMSRNEIKEGRLADFVQRVVSTAIERDLNDPALRNVVITEVRVTSDFHIAFVFWISKNKRQAAAALEKAKGKLRFRVARGCSLRVAPVLEFRYDELQEKALRIEEKIEAALREDEKIKKESSEKDFAGKENPYRTNE